MSKPAQAPAFKPSVANEKLRDDINDRARSSRQAVAEGIAYRAMMTPEERNVPVAVDAWLGTLSGERLADFVKRVTALVNAWK